MHLNWQFFVSARDGPNMPLGVELFKSELSKTLICPLIGNLMDQFHYLPTTVCGPSVDFLSYKCLQLVVGQMSNIS